MKKTILSLVLVGSVIATPALAMTPTEEAVAIRVAEMQAQVVSASSRWQIYTSEQRNAERVADVAKMNNVSLEEAAKIARRGWHAQNAALGRSPLWPHYGLAFRALTGNWVNVYSLNYSYAGWNPLTGQHVMTAVTRNEVRDDNFWYCAAGLTYTYGETVSECR